MSKTNVSSCDSLNTSEEIESTMAISGTTMSVESLVVSSELLQPKKDAKTSIIPALFKDINEDQGFYFIHSYFIDVKNKKNIMTTTNYGGNFVSGITSSNIYAVQFHPEKSHSNGMKLLKNFSDL